MDNWEERYSKIIQDVHAQSDEDASQTQGSSDSRESASYSQTFERGKDVYGYTGNFKREDSAQYGTTSISSPKYVSRAAFIICLILAMLISAVLGAAASIIYLKPTHSTINKVVTLTNYDLVKSTGSQLTIQEIAIKNENAVVAITTESISTSSWLGQYVTQGAGSGIIYSEDGYIITNNHVIEGATTVKVTLANGSVYDARLVATDSTADVAVIKIEEAGLTPVTFADYSKVCVGELAVAIGNPLGTLSGTVTCGIVSALEREITLDNRTMTLLQTSAAINPGNSGGGLFDGQGNLIGLVVAKSAGSDIEGLGFAIPSDRVLSVAKDLIENGAVLGRPAAGISILDLNNINDMVKYNVSVAGVYIVEVVGTEAQKAGLQVWDMIYKVDDKKVTSSTALIKYIQSKNVGDTVTFTIMRGKEFDNMITITTVLEDSTMIGSGTSNQQNQYGQGNQGGNKLPGSHN